ncbi:CapA family protein [Halomonas venusta]|uniref:CapA family protein n=1 Tax=Vreelandella venusta TaxID=44935 RepID=UPI00295E22DC|nr:CapA family protein [Halomonas venusta]MDW0361721.1 CapA family protein [Halomonas venusta]
MAGEQGLDTASGATISVVGDILIRRHQPGAAFRDGRYDFDYVFESVTQHIRATDLAIGNLETVFAGSSVPFARSRPNTRSMPLYNSPDELASALHKAGFHVLTTANNHCLDQGSAGLCRTLDVLDRFGFKHTGTARTQAEAEKDLIVEVNGFRIGILAFTYGTNDMPLPDDAPWMVDLIQPDMLRRTRAMKSKADLVFVCLHAGVEFIDFPSAAQRFWVNRLFHYGADAVLGCHPHVLQPMETRVTTDIDGIRKRRFVIYSLGNFTATLMRDFKTLTGVILHLKARWRPDGLAEVGEASTIPTFVDVRNRFRVVAIDNEIETATGPRQKDLEQARQHAVSILTTNKLRSVPLWAPDELAAVACGEWLRRPHRIWWDPKRVRLSEGKSWPLRAAWHGAGIVFLRDQEEFVQVHPTSRTKGCLVLPRELIAQMPSLPPQPILAVDNVEASIKALATHACLRHQGKRILVVGRNAPFMPELLGLLSNHGKVVTNVRGRRRFTVVTQFLASLTTDCDFAVFEVLAELKQAQSILRLMRPNVIVFADAISCHRFLGAKPFLLMDSMLPRCLIVLPGRGGDTVEIQNSFPDCEVIEATDVPQDVCSNLV